MQVSYSPTFADYWAFNVYVLRKQLRVIIWFAGASILVFLIFPLLLLIAPLANQPNTGLLDSYLNIVGVLFLPGLVGFAFAATYWGAKKRWGTAMELRETREYLIDDSGLHVKSVSTSGFSEWRIFTEAAVTDKFVFISTAQRQFHYFPISVVGDLDQLKDLLKSKVKKVTVS